MVSEMSLDERGWSHSSPYGSSKLEMLSRISTNLPSKFDVTNDMFMLVKTGMDRPPVPTPVKAH
jgi:hypothetical protein